MLPVSSGSILVVDATERCVRAGMTSPFSLRRMKDRGVGVYSALNLHSKTYIFDNNLTIVGSCNVSTGSRDRLIEAAIMTNNPKVCRDAGQFIRSIAVNPLSDSDLDDLCKIYEPPKLTKLTRGQMRGQALVMELNQEQGGGRASQVQPPRAVWESYFGIDWLNPCGVQLRMHNLSNSENYKRSVVLHDHNMTIEVRGAELPRPATLVIKRIGKNSYNYRVYRPVDAMYTVYDRILNMENDLQSRGRRWQIV